MITMKKLVLISLVIILTASLTSGQIINIVPKQSDNAVKSNESTKIIYRVYPCLRAEDVPRFSEIIGGKPGEYHDVIMSNDAVELLQSKGYRMEPIIESIPSSNLQLLNQYYTFPQIESSLEQTNDQFSSITRLFSIGKSYENRDIWCLEISDNPGIDESEPGVLFMGLHHAREWPTVSICMNLIEQLTTQYASNSSIKNLVENRRIWIVPCVNPDGYAYDHDQTQGQQWWRKNRHFLPTYDQYGIDLNRNYAGSVNGDPDGMWGSLGMSHYPSSEVYCGSNQFSELETQAIQQFFINHNICACISWHTHGELVLWPWGYTDDIQAPDDEYMGQVGREIASRITSQDGSGTYTPTQSSGLYPTTGDTADWMYGYSHYVLGKNVFAYTIEACLSFHPDEDVLTQVCKENLDGAIYLLNEAETINQLQPLVLPPNNLVFNKQDDVYTLSWNVANPLSQPLKYEIQELSESSIITDTADSDDRWNLNGFSQTSDRSYSSDESYAAQQENNVVSSMTTKYPIKVNVPMDISFYSWYDIETDWDMAFIEISEDNREFTVLDTFTGQSNGWTYHEYSLDAFLGKSLFIRFRYITDEQTTGEGFFIDDISPVVTYDAIETIQDNWQDTSINLENKPSDDFYYRVRGFNTAYGWGDWSMIKGLNESIIDNSPPMKPTIQGNQRGRAGEPYTYSIVTTDPEQNDIYYYVSWGDGTVTEWMGPYASGEEITLDHIWDAEQTYTIQARAKDNYNLVSEWATLQVIMPKTNTFYTRLLTYILQHEGLREIIDLFFSILIY
jgi:carboxypeptidase T